MSDDNPNKSDVMAVMKRLRGMSSNKTCFDCGAKNPTWASVTYGIFLCIDCSAVHRSLGVHLSFVRSTQLDTKWDWLQLRAMQLGGNANAADFFRSHGCDTTDAQQKYNSRAAQLYKDKLKQLAIHSMKVHGTKLHLEITAGDGSADEETKRKKSADEDDFFKTHSDTSLVGGGGGWQDDAAENQTATLNKSRNGNTRNEQVPEEGSMISTCLDSGANALTDSVPASKQAITSRKVVPKKTGKLGAQKVEANFEDFEKQAEAAEKRKLESLANRSQFEVTSSSEDSKNKFSTRLTYQDSEAERKKEEERLKKSDPKKAEQLERLGMGIGSRGKISHSITSDMTKIEQERPGNRNEFRSYGAVDRQPADNDWNRSEEDNRNNRYNSRVEEPAKSFEDYIGRLSVKDRDKSASALEDDYKRPATSNAVDSSNRWTKKVDTSASSGDDAQRKFGNAKSISSDMYFGNKESDYEVKSSLSRFDGKSSISSSEYFGTGAAPEQSTYRSASSALSNLQPPDLSELKESVRQGVTKVAGRLSSMATNVVTNLQDRYG